MKITPEHQQKIRSAVGPLDTAASRQRYREGDFPRANLVKDLDTRYRWDLLWQCPGIGKWMSDNGYTSTHVDTALRSIVRPLSEV